MALEAEGKNADEAEVPADETELMEEETEIPQETEAVEEETVPLAGPAAEAEPGNNSQAGLLVIPAVLIAGAAAVLAIRKRAAK